MTGRQIIDRLGGVHEVARLTGASRTAVYNWLRDGIPYRHWPTLTEAKDGPTNDELRASRLPLEETPEVA